MKFWSASQSESVWENYFILHGLLNRLATKFQCYCVVAQIGESGIACMRGSFHPNPGGFSNEAERTVEDLCSADPCRGCPWGDDSPIGDNERDAARASQSTNSCADPVALHLHTGLRWGPGRIGGCHRQPIRRPTPCSHSPRHPRSSRQENGCFSAWVCRSPFLVMTSAHYIHSNDCAASPDHVQHAGTPSTRHRAAICHSEWKGARSACWA